MGQLHRSTQAAIVAAVLATPLSAQAQVSGSWLGGAASWSNVANWSSNPAYPSAGGAATFNAASSGTITLDVPVTLSSISFAGAYTNSINGSTISLELAGPASVFADQPDSVDPVINFLIRSTLAAASGTGGLVKSGQGGLILRSGSYTGGTAINGGVISVANESWLGAEGDTVSFNGGALVLALTPNSGSLATVNHPMILGAGGGTIAGTTSNFMPQLLQPISGPGALTICNTHITSVSSASSGSISLQSSSTYSGQTRVTRGTLRLAGADGSIRNSSSVLVDGATLLLYQDLNATNYDRIGDGVDITLRNGATFAETRISTVAGGEQFGRLIVDGGSNVVTALTGMRELVRQNRATVRFNDVKNSGSIATSIPLVGSGTFGTASLGIVPWLSVLSSPGSAQLLPMTIQDGTIRGLFGSESTTSFATGANVSVSTTTAVASPVEINSMRMVGAGTISGATVTIDSGAIFNNGSATQNITAPIEFGASEGIIHGFGPQFMSFYGPIDGTNGLTIDGGARMLGSNTYTGTTTLNGLVFTNASILAGQPGPLGADTSAVIINGGGTLSFDGSIEFSRNLEVRSSIGNSATIALPFTHGAHALMSGNIQLGGPLLLQSSGLTISGNISGPGELMFSSVILTGSNSFTGGAECGAATLGTDTALGIGTLWIGNQTNTGTIAATNGPRTIANPIVFNNTTLTMTGSDPVTFTGPVSLGGLSAIVIVNSGTTKMLGAISGGSLTTRGLGLLETNPFTLQAVSVTDRSLKIDAGSSASAVKSLSITTGSALDLTGGAMVVDYTGASPGTQIKSWLTTGYAAGAWNGAGINSSTAAMNSLSALGFAEASQLGITNFLGQPVDSSAVVIRYTLYGDANLDGSVNTADFVALADHFGNGDTAWSGGDFNYDGTANALDFNAIADNFGSSVSSGSPLGSIVPEPIIVAPLSTLLLSKRRRHLRFASAPK